MAKRNEIESVDLTKEEIAELAKVIKNPFFFSTFIYVVNPVLGRVKFNLYPYQISVLKEFIINQFTIVLKFRQAGLTELIAMYSLWLAMYHPNKNIQIISLKDKVAKRLMRRIKFMYRNLPKHLQVKIINGRRGEFGTAQEIEFSNGSTIMSIPTTEDAGRSEAVTLLILDEAAMLRFADEIWAAALPTLSTGGSAIVNSTPYGIGTFYHKTWVNAMAARANGFMPIRLHWQMHPERDINWYRKMAQALGPRRTAQEIDGDFLSSGFNVFDLSEIKVIEEMLSEVDIIENRFNGKLRIVSKPLPNRKYTIGADISSGRASDYSTFSIMDQYGNEVGYFKGRLPVDRFAQILLEYGNKYNMATLAPETNDMGIAVVNKIQESGYPNLYYTEDILREKGKRKKKKSSVPGWLTTKKNRPVIIDVLSEDIRNDDVDIVNPFFCEEAYTFIYDSSNRPVALGKGSNSGGEDTYTDDSIMATAITNYVRKINRLNIITSPV